MIFELIATALLAAPRDAPLTMHGIGDLRIGTPVSTLRRMGARHERNPLGDDIDCDYWYPPQWPGIALMVSGGRVVRIETEDRRYRAASGARVGMTEAEIMRLYGSAMRFEPDHAVDSRYLVYRARAEPYALIVETDLGSRRAISIRVGTLEAVQLVEGCS